MSELRLGDMIDDHCSRCRLVTNHSIVSIVDGEPAKVHCRTCFNEHDYKHSTGVQKKTSTRKAQLFDQVLSSIVNKSEGEPLPKPAAKSESKS